MFCGYNLSKENIKRALLRFGSWFSCAYKKAFYLSEIEQSLALKWVFGATLFSYFITFNSWIGSQAITLQSLKADKFVCWPYFQNCEGFFWLSSLPHGYSQGIFYMGLFALIAGIVWAIGRGRWGLAHLGLLILFVWKFLTVFVFSMHLIGNYEYYHLAFSFILLFLSHKEFFLKAALVLFYFLSTAVKIHEGWIVGTYFSSMVTGLPIFPDSQIPFWTNQLIFMEMVGAWFLFSKHKVLRLAVLWYFIVFHLYSGILVHYRYPSTVLPTLVILFGLFYQPSVIPKFTKAVGGWLLLFLFCVGQSISHIIPGDTKLTLEGNYYGVYMFEANHQCLSTFEIFRENESRVYEDFRQNARHRCDPYKKWFVLKNYCNREGVDRIEWTFDHSINGNPFKRIVDVSNACELSYHPFTRNKWIKTEKDNPEIIAYPYRNFYQ